MLRFGDTLTMKGKSILSLILSCDFNGLSLSFLHFRTDEEEHSGSKYTRMDDDSIQDKERFAR